MRGYFPLNYFAAKQALLSMSLPNVQSAGVAYTQVHVCRLHGIPKHFLWLNMTRTPTITIKPSLHVPCHAVLKFDCLLKSWCCLKHSKLHGESALNNDTITNIAIDR